MRRDRVVKREFSDCLDNHRLISDPGHHNCHLRRPLSSSSTVLRQTNCLRATEFVGYAFPVYECAIARIKSRDFILVSQKRRISFLLYSFPFFCNLHLFCLIYYIYCNVCYLFTIFDCKICQIFNIFIINFIEISMEIFIVMTILIYKWSINFCISPSLSSYWSRTILRNCNIEQCHTVAI